MFQFQWQRDPRGYRITGSKGSRYIEPVSEQAEYYDPWKLGSESHVLFQTLAETPLRPEGYLRFAKSYGLLLGREPEPLDAWNVRIKSLRVAVKNWHDGDDEALVDAFEHHGFGQISVKLTWVADADRPQLRVAPATLYDALWIQFGWAVNTGLQIKHCIFCGTAFPFGPGTRRRKTAIYCSPRCQKIHAHKKRSEARR